eukprot:722935-Hanusia_phi.AAC.1
MTRLSALSCVGARPLWAGAPAGPGPGPAGPGPAGQTEAAGTDSGPGLGRDNAVSRLGPIRPM